MSMSWLPVYIVPDFSVEGCQLTQICSEEEAAAAKQRLEELWLRTKRRPSDTASLLKKEELEKR